MDKSCYKKAVARKSSEIAAMRLLSSQINEWPCRRIDWPESFERNGLKNVRHLEFGVHLVFTFSCHLCDSSCCRSCVAQIGTCSCMGYHVSDLAACHGMRVTPSCRFPSERDRPLGFFEAGISADAKVRNMTSCYWKCGVILPLTSLQDKLWEPLISNSKPQGHLWEMQRSTPRRSPTVIITASLSSFSPHDAMDSEFSKSPLCGAATAANLAQLYASPVALSTRWP